MVARRLSGSAAARRPHSKASRFIVTASPFSSIALRMAARESGTRPVCQA
jgi:hypothetical protein